MIKRSYLVVLTLVFGGAFLIQKSYASCGCNMGSVSCTYPAEGQGCTTCNSAPSGTSCYPGSYCATGTCHDSWNSTFGTWSSHCSTDSCSPPPTNHAPTCNLSGPDYVISGDSRAYNSNFTDSDGDTAHNCDWTTTAGSFAGDACNTETYTAPSGAATPTIGFSADDGDGKSCSSSKVISTYYCSALVPSYFGAYVGGVYWYPGADIGNMFAVESIAYNIQGPSGQVSSSGTPAFNVSAAFQEAGCNQITSATSDPIQWNIVALNSSLVGTDCHLNASVGLQAGGGTTACPTMTARFNRAPVCNGISFSGVAVGSEFSKCSPITMTVDASDTDGGPYPLEYHLVVACAGSGNGAFVGDGDNNITTSSNSVVWNHPGNIPVAGTTCNVNVTVNDGLETTTCSQGILDLTYTHSIVFDVDHFDDISFADFDAGMCTTANQPANEVSITLDRAGLPYDVRIGVDGSGSDGDGTTNGEVMFSGLPAPDFAPTPSKPNYTYTAIYTPVCATYQVGCQTFGGVSEYTGDGFTGDLGITPTQCGVSTVDLDLYEVESSRWITSIDGDMYSRNVSFGPDCGDEARDADPISLEDGFTASLVNFSSLPSDVDDGFVHAALTFDNDYVCSVESEADPNSNCGSALEINDLSYWFDELEIFTLPEHGFIEAVNSIQDVNDSGLVRSITRADFNDSFNGGGSSVQLNFANPGVSILYVTGTGDLDITKDVVVLGSGSTAADYPERLIIITNSDINIAKEVGYGTYVSGVAIPEYGLTGYRVDAVPNVDMALITSGTITIEGDADAIDSSNDLPLMLRGPIVANQIEINRDLWSENDMHPTASVLYHSRYISELTQLQRSECSVDLLGVGIFDVQFDYEE